MDINNGKYLCQKFLNQGFGTSNGIDVKKVNQPVIPDKDDSVNKNIEKYVNSFEAGEISYEELEKYILGMKVKKFEKLEEGNKIIIKFVIKDKTYEIICNKPSESKPENKVDENGYYTKQTDLTNASGQKIGYCVEKYNSQGQIMYSESYDLDNNLIGTTNYTYNAQGMLVQTQQVSIGSDGKKTEVVTSYNGSGVKTSETSTAYDKDGKKTSVSVCSYDNNGNQTERTVTKYTYNADGTKKYDVVESYDKDGKTTSYRQTIYNNDGSVKSEVVISYDENGKRTSEAHTWYDKDGNKTKEDVAYYGENGKKTSNINIAYDNNGNKTREIIDTCDDSGSIISQKNVAYDSQGNKTSEIITCYSNENGKKITSQSSVSYYENGNIKSESVKTYNENGERVSEKKKYYDNNGNKTSETTDYYENGKRTSQCRVTYGENGNMVREVVDNYNENGKRTSGHTVYYDENGNKTSESVENYDENGKKTSEITTYYDSDGNIIKEHIGHYDENGSYSYEVINYENGNSTTVGGSSSQGTGSTQTEDTIPVTVTSTDGTDDTPAVDASEVAEVVNEDTDETEDDTEYFFTSIVVVTWDAWYNETVITVPYNSANAAKYQNKSFSQTNDEYMTTVYYIRTVENEDGTTTEYKYNSATGSMTTIMYDANGKEIRGNRGIEQIGEKGKITKSQGGASATMTTKDIYEAITNLDGRSNYVFWTNVQLMYKVNGFGKISEMLLRMANNYTNNSFAKRYNYAKKLGCNKVFDSYNDTAYADYIKQSLTEALSIYGYPPELVKGYNFPANSALSKTISDGSNVDPDMKNFVRNNIEKIKNGNFPISGAFNSNKDLYYSIHGFEAIGGKISGTTLTLTLYDIYDFDQSYLDKLQNTPESNLTTSDILNAAGAAAMKDGRLTPYYFLIEVKIDLTKIFTASELSSLGIG